MILFISSGLCVIFLLLHSLYFRPFRATVLILAFCLPLSALYGNLYDFKQAVLVIPIGYGIPFVQIVGFFFAFYCALTLATHIVEERDESGRRTARYFPLLVWTVFITIFIGLGIEYANFTIKWWTWRPLPGTEVGKIMLVGVWGWRPLLGMPLLLQFFIDRGFRVKFPNGPRILLLAAFIIVSAVVLLNATGTPQELARLCVICGSLAFSWYLIVDVGLVLVAVLRHPKMRVVVPLCTLWFFFFLIWMIFVDRVHILRVMTMFLWPLVLLLGRIKKPEIELDRFIYAAPRPLFGRRGERP